VIGISIPQALSKVQEHLRKQGKPLIQVRESTLVQQLIALGQMVGKDGQPIDAKSRGEKTQNTRLGGTQTRVVRFLAATLGESHDDEEQPTGLQDLSQGRGEEVVGCLGSPGSCQPARRAPGASAA